VANFRDLARGRINGVRDGKLKLVCDPHGRKLLGAQIVGEGATELVHVAQMALIGGMDVDTFVDHVFNFPTFAEAYRMAALRIVAARGASLRAIA
jgi:NAD(P) transhydrogenase